MDFRDILATEFAPYRALSSTELDQLTAHYDLLVRWNRKLNLTRISSPEGAARLHYCESLLAALRLPVGPLRIADIGSGGGFPGIPMAILRPECSVTLIESHQRKAVFLTEASRDLPNVRVLANRAEEIQQEFDWLVSRAVTPEDVLELPYGGHRMLLVGAEDAKSLGGGELLPWGKERYLVSVPRGTFPRTTNR